MSARSRNPDTYVTDTYVKHLMNDDYAFFEYQAKITNAGHAENEGAPVHRMIKMKSLDEHGKRRRNIELEQQAGDDVLFVINPGPHRKKSTRVSGLSAKKPKGGNSARPASRRRLRDLFLPRLNLPFPPHQPFKNDHRKKC